MKMKPIPPQKLLHELLDYDRATGIFRWKPRNGKSSDGRWNGKWAAKVAGSRHAKGIKIVVNCVAFPAHRLAWVYVYGDVLDTKTQVDHKNCDWYQNWIDNLRPATHGQNASNSRGWGKKALPKGVSTQPSGKGYRARIGVDGEVINLGTFDTPGEAHAAYLKAAIAHKGEFARAA